MTERELTLKKPKTMKIRTRTPSPPLYSSLKNIYQEYEQLKSFDFGGLKVEKMKSRRSKSKHGRGKFKTAETGKKRTKSKRDKSVDPSMLSGVTLADCKASMEVIERLVVSKIQSLMKPDQGDQAQLMLWKQNSFESIEYVNAEDRINQKLAELSLKVAQIEKNHTNCSSGGMKDILARLDILEGKKAASREIFDSNP